MKINLECDSRDSVATIYVNGTLACEVAVGKADTRDDLENRVLASRITNAVIVSLATFRESLRAAEAAPDHVHKTAEARRREFICGFLDGFCGKEPRAGLSYGDGHESGHRLSRLASQMEQTLLAIRFPAA